MKRCKHYPCSVTRCVHLISSNLKGLPTSRNSQRTNLAALPIAMQPAGYSCTLRLTTLSMKWPMVSSSHIIALYSLAERAQHSCQVCPILGTLLSSPGFCPSGQPFPGCACVRCSSSNSHFTISILHVPYLNEYIQRCLEDLMSNKRPISSLQLRASPPQRV